MKTTFIVTGEDLRTGEQVIPELVDQRTEDMHQKFGEHIVVPPTFPTMAEAQAFARDMNKVLRDDGKPYVVFTAKEFELDPQYLHTEGRA